VAYDEGLAERLRELLAEEVTIEEKRMFGGLSFLLNGNLSVGVIADELIVRVGPDAHAEAMEQPGVRAFDFTGRPMVGWVVVAPEAIEEDPALQVWVDSGLQFAGSLPPK